MPKGGDKELEKIVDRKFEALKIALERDVAFRKTTYLEYVELVHNALPELDFEEIDTSTTFLGKKFSAPLIIDSMVGGTEETGKINETLARAAEELGLGMGVGSQRAALRCEALAETFSVARKVAPNIFLMANIGGAQLSKGLSVEDAKRLIDMVDADALAIHLNPLQELVQPEGEPCFKGVLSRIGEFTSKLRVPIVVKEVGSGISREAAVKLELAGVAAINVAGVGGTCWAAIEGYRAEEAGVKNKAELSKLFREWGLPTAVSIIEVRRSVKLPLIASGGIRTGLDIAKCVALGADICGVALPLLKKAVESKEEVIEELRRMMLELKATMFLVGARRIEDLKKVRYMLTGPLFEWASLLG